MIKKYKKIGTLLLGLSCLTGGFFIPVENNSLIPTVQAAEKSDKLVCNMTTKELFNVVYGYLREKDLTITFAMPPQSADDYGLITIRTYPDQWVNYNKTAIVQGRSYFNLYIDKGSSRDFSILSMAYYYGDYNYLFDYIRYPVEGFSSKDAYYPEAKANMNAMADGLVDYCKKSCEEYMQTLYNDLSARVKRASSTAPSRSKER